MDNPKFRPKNDVNLVSLNFSLYFVKPQINFHSSFFFSFEL